MHPAWIRSACTEHIGAPKTRHQDLPRPCIDPVRSLWTRTRECTVGPYHSENGDDNHVNDKMVCGLPEGTYPCPGKFLLSTSPAFAPETAKRFPGMNRVVDVSVEKLSLTKVQAKPSPTAGPQLHNSPHFSFLSEKADHIHSKSR